MSNMELLADQVREAERLAVRWTRMAHAQGVEPSESLEADRLTRASALVAAQELLTALGLNVVAHYRDRSPGGPASADLTVGFPPLRMMVCAYSPEDWQHIGRCVPHALAATLPQHADALLWATVERDAFGEVRVGFEGWSMVADVLRAPVYRVDDHCALDHQLTLAQVRPFGDLLALWRSPAKAA